jgi:hypothetical protein
MFALDIPADTPEGDSIVQLRLAMLVAVPTGNRTFDNREELESMQLPITIRSPTDRTLWRWLHRGIAVGAWALTFAAAYWISRARPRSRPAAYPGRPADAGREDLKARFYLLLILLGVASVGMGGQLAFVRLIMRTTAVQSSVLTTGLMVVWLLALVAGAWRGHRRRARVEQFRPVRLRAVLGTEPITTAFRAAPSRLPPSLSRDADRHTEAELIQTLESAGCAVRRRRKRLDVTWSSLPLMRIRWKRPAPWTPEDLQVQVPEGIDLVPWLRELADLYGPIEYTGTRGETTIVEPTAAA